MKRVWKMVLTRLSGLNQGQKPQSRANTRSGRQSPWVRSNHDRFPKLHRHQNR